MDTMILITLDVAESWGVGSAIHPGSSIRVTNAAIVPDHGMAEAARLMAQCLRRHAP